MSTLFPAVSGPVPKVNVCAGQLPGYVAASQAPTKRTPWRTIRQVTYGYSVTVILPDTLHRVIWDGVEADLSRPQYAKVIMKLEDVLRGEFFTEYIKKGNILMISEGELGIDDTFSLQEGILRLELSKEVYERAGLQGVPVPSDGRKHIKARYLVEVNLRLPSALHGKKGFDRLLWAAQHVLDRSLNWLFLDLDADTESQIERPLDAHHPTVQTLMCSKQLLSDSLTPATLSTHLADPNASSSGRTEESVHDIFEYLDMVTLDSPRVQAPDQIDSFLTLYAVPNPSKTTCTLQKITWNGLISSRWVLELVCSIIKQSRIKATKTHDDQWPWLSISVSSFQTQVLNHLDGYTILLQPSHNVEQPVSATDHDPAPTNAEEDASRMSEEGREAPSTKTKSKAEPDGKSQQTSQFIPPRGGLQRFVCAEYVDSMV